MTSFVHCRGCGVQIHETAPTCPKCGAPQLIVTPVAKSAAAAETPSNTPLSATWEKVFALIDKAGGFALPNVNTLSSAERNTIRLNILAFLFGPLYFLFKGMWKRGIMIFVALVAVNVFVANLFQAHVAAHSVGLITLFAQFAMLALISTRANRDYYRKVRLGITTWW
jgi:hypothetical protein